MTGVDRIPLTAYQRDVWVANSSFPQNPQFNCQIYDRFHGDVDLEVLRECLRRAAAATDVVGLRFGEEDGVPYQWRDATPPVRVVDLSGEAAPAACREWIRRSFDRPLDLLAGPTSELTLLRESESTVVAHVKAHHIVADAWGLQVLLSRVRADYAHRMTSGDYRDAAPSRYLDLIGTDRRYRASAAYQQDREHFRATLAGATPDFFPRKEPAGARRSARHSFVIERAVIDRVRQRGESVFSHVSAAFAVYLSRVLGTEEVVLGVPLLNRPAPELREVVGHFANTLPLRVRPGGGRSMAELVAEVRAATRELKPHERLPLGDVLRDLPVPGDGGPRRLFDVTLAYLRWPNPPEVPGAEYRTVVQARAHDQDALAVVVNELDDVGDVLVDMDYGCDVFDEDFPPEAAGRHIAALIRRTLDTPDRPLAEVPMLDGEERHALVYGVNATEYKYPAGGTVHGLFTEQAARTPDRTAVEGGPGWGPLSYAELDTEANRVGRALAELGVGPGDRVAVLRERSPSMLAAVLGVLKSGAAYLPVDAGSPPERTRLILRDSGAKAALVDDGRWAADELGLPVLTPASTARVSGDPLEPVAAPHDPAYVIYTSGSTGRPKGVVVEHRSVVNRLRWMQRRYPVGEGDVLLQKTPISFDVSVWELFWWGWYGARLALLPPDAAKDPREILRAVAEHRVSVVHFVPSMFAAFLDVLERDPGARIAARSLRYVFCSGEALPPELVNRSNRVLTTGPGGPTLINLYGPTEATVDVSWYECPAGTDQRVSRVPIGRPIDNIRLYVLDRDGAPQPAGAPGELWVAGVGVARGYLGQPELTRERFVDDPFVPGARMYRTGDLVRRLADGELEYLGRLDEQVKIRGNRVELGEVRTGLASCPGVRGAAVTAVSDDTRGTHLAGYYTADEDLDPAALGRHLARTLPSYMVPAHFQRVAALPLTANGKLDKRALPPPDPLTAGRQRAPRDGTEAALAEIWSEVLGLADVGVHQNYHALGGDSILMLRIRAKAEARGLRFDLADLVTHPTVAGLAEHTTRVADTAREAPLEPFALVSAVDRALLSGAADAYPATQLQLGLLYHGSEQQESATYHDVFRYTLRMPWDETALRGAFTALTGRHPVLRTAFGLAGYSEPLQIVHPRVTGGLDTVDLRAGTAEAAEAEVRHHIAERRFHRYDLTAPPLAHFRAHAMPGGDVDLVLSFHHAILDGWSVATLVRELLQDCLHRAGHPVPPVPDSPRLSPAEYVRAEQRALADESTRRFWQQRLAGAEATQLDGHRRYSPEGRRDPADAVFSHRVDLPEGLRAALPRFCREREVPLKSVLFAAHSLLLRLFSGADDVVTGLVTHGRPEQSGGDRLTGLFLGVLPVRVGSEPRTWLDVVREVYLQERESHPHRHYPLSAIQEDRGGETAFSTAFNYVNPRVLAEFLAEADVELLRFDTYEETNFELLVNAVVDPADGRTWLRMDHAARVFTREQGELFGSSYRALLQRIVEHPDEDVDFSFLAEQPAAPARTVRTQAADLVRRFDAQVAAAPDAVAVAYREQRWSYRELARAAERVARSLLRLGAGPGARVGVAMDRSPEAIATVLGVAKAGGACVPLDVTYPEDRLRLMADRADPIRVITRERYAGLFPDSPVLLLDDALAAGDTAGGTEPLPAVSGEDVAYLLFTSGSTGEPKGVELPHRSLANYLEWQIPAPSGAAGGKTLQFAPLSFDVAFQEICSTLCGGGTLQLIDEEQRRDMPALLRLLDRERVERVFLPYVALQQLAEASAALALRPADLRVIVSSGEQLRVTDEIRALCAGRPGTVLENQYGPTETHLLTHFTMVGDPAAFPALPPVGTPLDGIELYLLDSRMRPVPPGATGTVHIGGVCLAHGYFRRPDLTEERFVPNPFGAPGERLYRTGDLARVLPGGDLVWLGREDDQVKVRGFRVELAEVELALTKLSEEHPGIREVAVVARTRGGGDAFLAAFLVGDADSVPLDAIRSRLRQNLPDYMVPSHYEWIPALPLAPSGKRDDAQLRRRALTARAAADRVAPRDDNERALAELLAELLHLRDVGVHDDFFALGGTSLTAMRLVTAVEQLFGVSLPISALVAAPTVAGLAARVRASGADAAFDPVVPIRRGGDRPPMFLVHPLGGNVLCYVRLAEHLPDNQPVYALQAAGTHPGTEPLTSVPEIAASYLAAIRRVHPEGPYIIGGWSFGGFVAFEMARQLRAEHPRDVTELILIDPIAVAPGERPSVTDTSLLEWFFWELLWLRDGGDAALEPIPGDLSDQQRLTFVAERAAAAGILPAGTSGDSVHRLFRMFKAHWNALLSYTPPPSDQDLTLLRATGPLPAALRPMHGAAHSLHEDPSNGWRDLTTGRLDIVDVPGDHLVLLDEPQVATVAAAVARAAAPPPPTILRQSGENHQ